MGTEALMSEDPYLSRDRVSAALWVVIVVGTAIVLVLAAAAA